MEPSNVFYLVLLMGLAVFIMADIVAFDCLISNRNTADKVRWYHRAIPGASLVTAIKLSRK